MLHRSSLAATTFFLSGILLGCGSDSTVTSAAPSTSPQVAWDSAWAQYARTPSDSIALETPAARFRSFESVYPTSDLADDARWWFGYVRYQQGRWSEARAILLSLPVAYPASVRIDNALHYAARCLVEEDSFAAARDSIRHFLSDPRFAKSAYRADSWYYLGRSWMGLQGMDSARACFRVVLDSFRLDTLRNADAVYQTGRTWYADSMWTTAQDWFGRILDSYPSATLRQDNALYWRSRCQHRRDVEDSAISGYRALVVRYPSSTYADQAAYQVGAAFYDRAQRIGSASLFDSALSAESSFLVAWPASNYRDDAIYEQGKSLYRKSSPALAEPLLDSVVAWNPWSNLRDYALYYKSRIHADAGDCAGTADILATLATSHPASAALPLARAHSVSKGCPVP